MERRREVSTLSEIEGILSYDEQVFMPPGAAQSRAAQRAALAGIIHDKRTGAAMQGVVEQCRGLDTSKMTLKAKANVRDALEAFDVEALKSRDLCEKEARLESESFVAWKASREASDFTLFKLQLQQTFDLAKEVALVTRPTKVALHQEPYDGALDKFERGMTATRLDAIFAETKQGLKPLLDQVLNAQSATPQPIHPALIGGVGTAWEGTEAAQAALGRKVAEAMGYDFSRGRLDVSTHPFTGGAGPRDTRITTRYSANWLEAFSGTVHETGHALYEQGRDDVDEDAVGLPSSVALSMGVHESQSLLWERMVQQSRAFWIYATPLFHKAFPHTRQATPEDFYVAANVVQAGAIRVEADELTYPLHVFLRFDLERKLFRGELQVEDVPAFWNAAMKRDLGVQVDKDAQGCLQDIHWSFGAIGYFPSYTLGAIMAAQLFQAASAQLPSLDEDIAKGHFAPLREWLREQVHKKGSIYASPDELLNSVTGGTGGIDPGPYLEYLKAKYTDLYKLEPSE
ncbi:M32, carboxypeptidase Taq metallopeptidase peptidase [Pelagophyceae sp. CCMP2097]|nr:M32, carboxypeptidase Taq metallopeptidase peptidase [Pelagophyceae sp. CCMP2097]